MAAGAALAKLRDMSTLERLGWAWVFATTVGCFAVDPNPTLNDLPVEVGDVDLGAVNPWVVGEDNLRFRAFVLEHDSSNLRAEVDGEMLLLDRLQQRGGTRTLVSYWPRTKIGRDRATVRLFMDDALIGQWTVTREVVDVGVTVCALPGTEEGLNEPRCTRPGPFDAEVRLPAVAPLGSVLRDLEFAVDRGSIEVGPSTRFNGAAAVETAIPERALTISVDSLMPLFLGRRPAVAPEEKDTIALVALGPVAGHENEGRFTLRLRANAMNARIVSVDVPEGVTVRWPLPVELPMGSDIDLEFIAPEPRRGSDVRVWYELAGARRAFRVRL